ncbi:hypothetical protein OJF2_69190 [Aquisphaera giovannonii]|uniref:Outer membrane lipoprotein-sorting protein n=1 Tax=Aquisphaera giovannonii TaxID=406548 RepID=A0A5B9WCC0_9BACT|nr:hypothetical protein [Aquisphaera giovannonii]QEH38318.1 hypothetical protein OJF2_69190 [Aquisphaera giovannonii]
MIMAAIVSLTLAGQAAPDKDADSAFRQLKRYHASFQDVSFLHIVSKNREEGQVDASARWHRSRGRYTYRSDGASLLDNQSLALGDEPVYREIRSLLKHRLEILDATPGAGPPIRERVPGSGPGGPGSLASPDSPERFFWLWYLATLGDPAEHKATLEGFEDIDGHRCVKIRMLKQPQALLRGWIGPLPFVRMWLDPLRDGYPIRVEWLSGDAVETRVEILSMERVELGEGRRIWLPVEGRTSSYIKIGMDNSLTLSARPTYVEKHKILINSVKIDQHPGDDYFSVKTRALADGDGTAPHAR